jgi:hypothetical protein
MIEFNGLKIDTRSLLLIAGTIVLVVALWPDGGSEPETAGAPKSDKAPVQRYGDTNQGAKQGRTAQAELPPPWQDQFPTYQPKPYGNSGPYTGKPALPQAGAYAQQPAYGDQRFRPPYGIEQPTTRNQPNYNYGAPGSSPYGYNPYPGIRFRPKEQPKAENARRYDRGVPGGQYSPTSPGGSTSPSYTPTNPLPWEYSPTEVSPYDVAPSGSNVDLNHLYTVR